MNERAVKRACQMAREAAVCDPCLSNIKVRRFHLALDALTQEEGEAVYDTLRGEGWYRFAAAALARDAVPELDENSFCPHGIPYEFCGICHDEEAVVVELPEAPTLTDVAYSPPGQAPHSNARKKGDA